MATCLQLVQQARGEMGLSVPSVVVGNGEQDIIQTLALLNAVGYELQREFDWQKITKEYRFTTVYYQYTGDTTEDSTSVTGMSSIAGLSSLFMVTGTGINPDTYVSSAAVATVVLTQAASATGSDVTLTFSQTKYAMPADFDRWVNRTQWDKTAHWEMLGPETGQQWQWLKSGWISTGPRVRFRPLGGYFQIWPPLTSNDYLGFEYVSNYTVMASADVASLTTTKASFTVDSDVSVFPDRLMVLGLKHKYFQAKGFGDVYAADFEKQKSIAKAADSGAKTLSFNPRPMDYLLSEANIPDARYGE